MLGLEATMVSQTNFNQVHRAQFCDPLGHKKINEQPVLHLANKFLEIIFFHLSSFDVGFVDIRL